MVLHELAFQNLKQRRLRHVGCYHLINSFPLVYILIAENILMLPVSRRRLSLSMLLRFFSQKLHNYGYYAKMMYHLFSLRPYRLSGIRVIPSRGSPMTVSTSILQESGSRLSGDIFKNISQQKKTFKALENCL